MLTDLGQQVQTFTKPSRSSHGLPTSPPAAIHAIYLTISSLHKPSVSQAIISTSFQTLNYCIPSSFSTIASLYYVVEESLGLLASSTPSDAPPKIFSDSYQERVLPYIHLFWARHLWTFSNTTMRLPTIASLHVSGSTRTSRSARFSCVPRGHLT